MHACPHKGSRGSSQAEGLGNSEITQEAIKGNHKWNSKEWGPKRDREKKWGTAKRNREQGTPVTAGTPEWEPFRAQWHSLLWIFR